MTLSTTDLLIAYLSGVFETVAREAHEAPPGARSNFNMEKLTAVARRVESIVNGDDAE